MFCSFYIIGKVGLVSTVTSTSVQTDAIVGGDSLPKDETIPCYIEEFEKDAQDDIIMLGSLSQEQVRVKQIFQ